MMQKRCQPSESVCNCFSLFHLSQSLPLPSPLSLLAMSFGVSHCQLSFVLPGGSRVQIQTRKQFFFKIHLSPHPISPYSFVPLTLTHPLPSPLSPHHLTTSCLSRHDLKFNYYLDLYTINTFYKLVIITSFLKRKKEKILGGRGRGRGREGALERGKGKGERGKGRGERGEGVGMEGKTFSLTLQLNCLSALMLITLILFDGIPISALQNEYGAKSEKGEEKEIEKKCILHTLLPLSSSHRRSTQFLTS